MVHPHRQIRRERRRSAVVRSRVPGSLGELFKRLPEPTVVVCDGGPGMHAALKEHWPNARVQRCLVHLQRNVRKYVTTRSKTPAGKALWGLALKLTRVKTADDAAAWSKLLIEWESAFLYLMRPGFSGGSDVPWL